jgi:hypothetical protein
MEYVEKLPARQPKRTLVASIVSLAIGAAAATGIWALADDDSTTAAGGSSTPTAATDDPGSQYGTAQYRLPPTAVTDNPGSQYGTAQYRLPPDAQPAVVPQTGVPYDARTRFPRP